MTQCDNHSFTLPVHRGRRANGDFVDFFECEKCDGVLYVESDPVSQRTVFTRRLDAGDDLVKAKEAMAKLDPDSNQSMSLRSNLFVKFVLSYAD